MRLLGQDVRELREGPVQQHAHGSLGATGLLGDLRSRQPLEMGHRHDRALVLGELVERGLHASELVSDGCAVARRSEAPVDLEQSRVPLRRGPRIQRDVSQRVTLLREVELAAVHDLAQRGPEQPLPESTLARIAEVLDLLEHLATHGLHEVGARLARPNDGAGPQPNEGAQFGQVSFEESVHGFRVPIGGLPGQSERVDVARMR